MQQVYKFPHIIPIMKEEMPVVIRVLDIILQIAYLVFIILSTGVLVSVFRGKIFDLFDTLPFFGLAITTILILSLEIIKYKRIIGTLKKTGSKRKTK